MSEMNGLLDLDAIGRKETTVKHGGEFYTLRDASEKATIEYEASRWRIERDGDEIRRVPSPRLFDSSSVLVSYCLFDKENKLVPLEVLRTWSHDAVEKLFDWVVDNSPGMRRQDTKEGIEKEIADLQQRLKKLDERPLEEMAKNSPAATVGTSR